MRRNSRKTMYVDQSNGVQDVRDGESDQRTDGTRSFAASNEAISIHCPEVDENTSGFLSVSTALKFGLNRIFQVQLVAVLTLLFSCFAAAGDIYLRTGAGLDSSAETVFKDRDCMSTSPAALYGCGISGDEAPLRSVGDFETSGVFELGLGYKVSPKHRFELLVENRSNLEFHGRANFLATDRRQSVAADLSSLQWH